MSHPARTKAHTTRRPGSGLAHGSALALVMTLSACSGEYSGIPRGETSGQPAALTDPRSGGNASQVVDGELSGADHTAQSSRDFGAGSGTTEEELQPLSSGNVQARDETQNPDAVAELSANPFDSANLGLPDGENVIGSTIPVNVAGGFLVEPQLVGCAVDQAPGADGEETGPTGPLATAQEVIERVLCRVEFLTTWLDAEPSGAGSGLFLQGLTTAQAAVAAAKERFVGTSVAQVESGARTTAARVYSFSNREADTIIVGEFGKPTSGEGRDLAQMDMGFAFMTQAQWQPLATDSPEHAATTNVPYRLAFGGLGYSVYVPPAPREPEGGLLPTPIIQSPTLTTTAVVDIPGGASEDVLLDSIYRTQSSLTKITERSDLTNTTQKSLIDSSLAAPVLQ